jgi:mono/diheme cytochrome c family protein
VTGLLSVLSFSNSIFLLLLLGLWVLGLGHGNRQSSQQKGEDIVKQAPAVSGEYIFKWYCAACHGKNGKGNGPAASELKVPPPDLTALSKRNKGKFPANYITQVLVNGPKPSAHGTADMPTWGPLFEELNVKGKVTVETNRVIEYLKSIQQK